MGLAGSIKVPEDKQDEKDNDVTMAVAIVALWVLCSRCWRSRSAR